MSGDKTISESLVLDDSGKGVIIKGITDDAIAAKSGLQAGDEIVGATIHLDHLNKAEVLKILKTLEPYDDNMKVLTKKELGVGLGSLGLDPEVNLKKDLSLEAPSLSLDTGLSDPKVNGNLPSLSLNKPAPQFSSPSFGISAPEVNGGLGEVSAPQLKAPGASLNVNNPGVKTNYESPKFSMPNFNLPKVKPKAGVSGDVGLPAVDVDAPGLHLDPTVDLSGPKAGFSGPDLNMNSPGVNLQAPSVDVDGHSGKFKWPHQKWKVKGRVPDADLSAPDVSMSTPDLKANIDAPGVDLNTPSVGVKTPSVDLQGPNVDADVHSGKFPWLHPKRKKAKGLNADVDLEGNLNTPELSAPKLEGGINAPDLDLNVPKADLKGPEVDVQSPDMNLDPSSKINWPHLKWKKPRGSKPDLDLDAGLSSPNLDLSAPNIRGELPDADVELPRAGWNSGVDLQMPNADLDAQPKINWPHLKWKKPKVHGPRVDADLNADLSAPDVDLSVPSADISGPDVGVTLPDPNVDFKAPGVDVDPPPSKFKFPTLKRNKTKNLDFGAELSAPDPKLNTPDLNVNVPKAELEAPNIDVSTPDIDGPTKPKWFTFKKPKFGTLKGPKADFDADLKAPDVDLKGPDLGTKGIDLSAPKLEGNLGGSGLGGTLPDLNLKGPGVDSRGLEFPDGNLNLPQLNLSGPNLSRPNLSGPELSANVKAPSIDANPTLKAPNFSLSAPKSDLQIPAPTVTGDLNAQAPNLDVDMKKAKLGLPDLDLSSPLKGPDVDINGGLSAPDLNLSAPAVGGIKTPGLDLNMPKADLEGPNLDLDSPDIEGPSGKFKWFNIKKPKIGTWKTGKADLDADVKPPDVDLTGPDVKVPDLNLSSPNLNGNVSLPDVPGAGGLSLSSPNMDVGLPKAELNGPQLQTPDITCDPHLGNFSLPKGKSPQLPTVEGGIEGPKVKTGALDSNFSGLTPPNVDGSITAPKINTHAPTLNVGSADATLKAPGVKTSLDTPELGVASGEELKGSSHGKLKWPFKWGFKSGSGTDDEGGADSDPEPSKDDVPAFKFHQLPKMNIDGVGGIGDTVGLSRQDTQTKDYVVSRGIRLPIVNSAAKPGEKISVLERLQLSKSKSCDSTAGSKDSTLERGGTFQIDQPGSALGLLSADGSALNDNDKLSFGLSNMLGLNVKDSDAN